MAMIGRVRPGQGLGAPRMADPDVMALLERTVGFRPVPGTLNVMLDHPSNALPTRNIFPPAC